MQKYLRLKQPEGIRTQAFEQNVTSTYKRQGLVGHTGEDYSNGWKSPVKAVVTGEVYSTINIDNSDLLRYRAIFQLVDTIDFSYEISYGHIHESFVKKGDRAKVGQVIALEGNYGDVYSNGKAPTPAQREKGAGSHLHFQVRKCKRVKRKSSKKTYLRDDKGTIKRDGYYYEVVDYNNGVNGCVDPALFYELDVPMVIKLLRLLGILKD